MAQTTFGPGDPLAVKLWAKTLQAEALKATWAERFIGDGADAMIMRRDETSKAAGDTITYGLRMQLSSSGTLGDGVLEGNEEALTTYTDALVINQLRGAVRSAGRMSQQRVTFSIRSEMLAGLRDYWSDRIDFACFNQLCGNTGPANAPVALAGPDARWTGNQACIAPDAGHYTTAHAGGTDDTSIASSDLFTLSMLDKCVERAKTTVPAIRPLTVNGKKFYVAWLHPYQVTDMRTNTSTGQFLDIQKAAMTGGLVDNNPIFDGSLGVYNGVILHEDYRVTPGVNPGTSAAIPTVRRAVFCGAQSGMIAYGRDNSDTRFTWVEELFDYENQLGVAAGTIFGMKKTVFNSQDFATIVMSTYAVAH